MGSYYSIFLLQSILMGETRRREDRIQRWYFGGLAAMGATCFTHPLDLLKVQLQTHQQHAKIVSTPLRPRRIA